MLWVLKRTISMRWFFWTPKTNVKTDGLENINNFTLKKIVYVYLYSHVIISLLLSGTSKMLKKAGLICKKLRLETNKGKKTQFAIFMVLF